MGRVVDLMKFRKWFENELLFMFGRYLCLNCCGMVMVGFSLKCGFV